MRVARVWLARILGALQRSRFEGELRDELDAHLAMHIEDNQRRGMDAGEARRHALIKLGGVEQISEASADRRGLPLLEVVLKDLRFALRLLRRTPGFSVVVLLTLAVGIGANAIMFSVVNTLLLRPLPYADAERLVSVQTVDAVRRTLNTTAPPDYYRYRRDSRTLSHLEAYYGRPYNVTGGREPERVPTLIVSPGFFSALGVPPAMGRGFIPQDEAWGSHRVVILTSGFWQQRFGGDPTVVGKPITLNGESFVIVGVMPQGFSFLGDGAQLFVPMAFAPGDNLNSHSNYFLQMIGRVKSGMTREQARSDLNAISDAIIAEFPINQGTAIDVVALRDVLIGRDVRQALLVLLGAVGVVLLITCANLANLLLARAAARQREIAVRLAIGASRARLLRQFLAESLLLSLAGGGLGLLVAYGSANALNALSQRVLPRATDIAVDPTVLFFTFAVATMTGLLLGLAPAAYSTIDPNLALKEGSRSSDSGGRHRARAALVVGEVALSLVLLAGAGLLVKSMYRLLHVETGFDATRVLTLQINLPPQKYVDRELERTFSPDAYVRANAFFKGAIGRIRTLPGVQAVGSINGLPLAGEIWGKNVTFYDRPLPADLSGLSPIQYRVVIGDYFRALSIRIRSGRAFTDADDERAPKVAIVNQELVRRYWDGRDPVGKVISVNPPLQVLPKSVIEEARKAGTLPDNYEPDRFTVVGVADDVLYGALDRRPAPLVYVPYLQGSEGSTNMFLTVRSAADPIALTGAIKEQIAQLDRDQPVSSVQMMEARLAASVAQRRVQMNVLGMFAAMAVLLAALGIYGVMSYAVTQRAREIGIRLALGAARGDVTGLIVRQGVTMTAVGLALGLAGALLTTRVMQSLLFSVSPTDPTVFGSIVALLAVTALCAAYLPARRAARVDPWTTLRGE